jgi:tRNA G18 (ribose-2'-O)-methylase SpoU
MRKYAYMKRKFYLILPDIRSCHNVGAMFRTADAFGVDKIFLVGYTPHPPKPQIDKVSLGAEKWVLWEWRKDLRELILELKREKFVIVGLEKIKKSIKIEDLRLKISDNVALVVGNEVDGIRPGILKLCDHVVHIPMIGKKESLNVSIAGGIAMYLLS